MTESVESILRNPARLAEVSKAVFDAVDTDGSGMIDKKELKMAMINVSEETGIQAPTDRQVQEALLALDKDGSGFIDVIEFQELVRQLLEAIIEE